MAKYPSWDAQVDISPSGPVITRNPEAEAPGQALAQVGEQIFRLGAAWSAEERQAEKESRHLQRTTQAEQFVLNASKRSDAVTAEMSGIADPDARQTLWENHLKALETEANGIADEKTREYTMMLLAPELRSRNKTAIANIQMHRLEQANETDQAMLDDAVRLRTVGPYLEHLERMRADGSILPEVQDRKKEFAIREVDTGLEMDAIRAQIHTPGISLGEGIRIISEWNPAYLNEEQKVAKRNVLLSEMRVKDANETQQQELRQKQTLAIENDMWVKIQTGNGDTAAILGLEQSYADGGPGIRPEIGQQMIATIATPGAPHNDPTAYDEMKDTVRDLYAGNINRDEGRKRLAARSGKLTDASRTQFANDIAGDQTLLDRAISDSEGYARGEIVTVSDQTLAVTEMMKPPEEQMKLLRERRTTQQRLWEMHNQFLRDYRKDHPEATADEIYIESRKIRNRLRQQSAAQTAETLGTWETGQVLPPGAMDSYDIVTRQRVVNGERVGPPVEEKENLKSQISETVPAGLEELWPGLNEQEKKDVRELLARGWTVQRILQEAGQ